MLSALSAPSLLSARRWLRGELAVQRGCVSDLLHGRPRTGLHSWLLRVRVFVWTSVETLHWPAARVLVRLVGRRPVALHLSDFGQNELLILTRIW